MRWEQGRATVDSMLARRDLERVTPSRAQADALVDQALRHLKAAETIAGGSSTG